MANNRMYLVHRPTGQSLMVGKRMLEQWYTTPSFHSNSLNDFFGSVYHENEGGMDDFFLTMETCTKQPGMLHEDLWEFKNVNPQESLRIVCNPSVPYGGNECL